MNCVLSSAYLPPISWFANLKTGEPILVEAYENYHKQTIRNRCTIDSPNGALNLTIPVDKSNFVGGKCLMKDVKISSHSEWQRQHWYALESSYFNSPFFEYLQDDFRPMYEKKWTYLMDFNEALLNKCCELIDIQPVIERTKEFVGVGHSERATLQGENKIGNENCSHSPRKYYQVFQHKHGFLSDLSIIDLIFNMGPEAVFYL